MFQRKQMAIVFAISTLFLCVSSYGQVCTVGGPGPPVYPTIASALADSDCTTVNIPAGTFNEANLVIPDGVTLQGAGPGSTILEETGNILLPKGDNVVIQNLTIQNGSQAVRVDLFLDNLQVLNVDFLNNSSGGIEIHHNTLVTNLVVDNCIFDGNGVGIRLASSAMGEGIAISNAEFKNSFYGFYQANGGNTGYVKNLNVENSLFQDNSRAAIYGEEMESVEITGNTFDGNGRGFWLAIANSGAGQPAGDITIQNNEFFDHSAAAIELLALLELDLPAVISSNSVYEDVGVLASNWAQIEIRLRSGLTHAPVTVSQNFVQLSGVLSAGATAAHAAKVRGDFAGVSFHDNLFDGQSVGGTGVPGVDPPTSGIVLVSDDRSLGSAPSGSTLTASGNTLTGFVNGVGVFDSTSGTFGGLTPGTNVQFHGNNIVGNSAFGVNNGAGPGVVDATDNWWGDPAGPSHPTSWLYMGSPIGPNASSGDTVSDYVLYDPWSALPVISSPRTTKMDVLAELQDLYPSGDKKVDKDLEKAIKHLEKSLADEYWEDDSHLTKKGKKAFSEEKKTVHELMKALKDGGPVDLIDAIIEIVAADATLARIAIDEALDASGDEKEIEKALKEFDKAASELASGDYDKAVDRYKKAWEKAMKALKKAVDEED